MARREEGEDVGREHGPLYDAVVRTLREGGTPVEPGVFRAMMEVELVNDGPVTVLIDSARAS